MDRRRPRRHALALAGGGAGGPYCDRAQDDDAGAFEERGKCVRRRALVEARAERAVGDGEDGGEGEENVFHDLRARVNRHSTRPVKLGIAPNRTANLTMSNISLLSALGWHALKAWQLSIGSR